MTGDYIKVDLPAPQAAESIFSLTLKILKDFIGFLLWIKI